MFYGSLSQWETQKQYFPTMFATAFSFLEGKDFLAIPAGKHLIVGESLFALAQDALLQPEAERKFEVHQKYIDIQLLLAGEEKQRFTAGPCPTTTLLEDNLVSKDFAFYTHPRQSGAIILHPGDFAVYFPGELHCPCCLPCDTGAADTTIRKIVFKIQADCIQ